MRSRSHLKHGVKRVSISDSYEGLNLTKTPFIRKFRPEGSENQPCFILVTAGRSGRGEHVVVGQGLQ